MNAPFLTFLSVSSPLLNDDPTISYDYRLSTTTYVAIVPRKDGTAVTKCLNPSSSHATRGRKRAFSSSNSGFLNPLIKQHPSLQKKSKLLSFWPAGTRERKEMQMGLVGPQKNLSPLHKLPTEILVRILHHLGTAKSVLRVAQTSRHLYNICHDHHLWYQLFSNRFFSLSLPPSNRYYQLYKDHVELDRRWAQGEPHVFYMNDDERHHDSIYSTAWIDTHTIASVSRDRSIKVWDLNTRKCMFTRYDAHQASILCVVAMKKKALVVTGSSDCTCTVWSLPDWNQIRQYSGHAHSVLSILALDDEMVATVSRDTTIQVWRVTDGKVRHVLRGHAEAVNAIKRLDDQRIVSASGDGTLKIWCLATGTCLETLTSDIGGLSCMQVTGSRTIWAGGLSSHIQVWELEKKSNLWKTVTVMNSGHTDLLRTIDCFEDKVVTAGYDKVIKVWDSQTGKCVLNFQSGHGSKIFNVLLGRTTIISAGHDRRIMVLDFAHQLSKELVRML
ncbi:WD40-repeat-containing domain protein [Fennellomyces sp. T-0311]|nr:WD40-repeat-containing domain protein [Fennellomyces sp. T-0311]